MKVAIIDTADKTCNQFVANQKAKPNSSFGGAEAIIGLSAVSAPTANPLPAVIYDVVIAVSVPFSSIVLGIPLSRLYKNLERPLGIEPT